MSTITATDRVPAAATPHGSEKHPKGLYVLFGTEMWERFSFYTMLAMLVLYMRDASQGFGWTTAKSADIYSWYQMFVYFTPLLGGFLADRLLGFRRSIMIGGVFFMAGHLLLAVPKNIPVFFTALVFLVVGNGFFKPNVSSLVGNLYREGSHLKDRAYLIFYMGINIGAFLAPIVAEFVKTRWGFHPAFAIAAGGMFISLMIFTLAKRHVAVADTKRNQSAKSQANENAITEDLPPTAASEAAAAMDAVPEWKRIVALIVIFLIVIVFWMIFHQNGSTLTLWADENTDWNVTGIISNAINPMWIIVLSLPLAWFWGFLDRRGLEPSTPAKIGMGMALTGLSFIVLYFGALSGGYTKPSVKVVQEGASPGTYLIEISPETIKAQGITTASSDVVIPAAKAGEEPVTKKVWQATSVEPITTGLARLENASGSQLTIAPVRKVSPWWLIMAYFVISLGELMLSPMGLSLVSKVAPIRMRGLMMGGWFAATAIGNKLTAIGRYWDVWSHAHFFLVLAMMAFVMSVVLFLLLRPLKKAMPGV